MIGTIGVGVGCFLALSITKIVFKKDLSTIIIFFYLVLFMLGMVMVTFGKDVFVPLAFDSGGVTTGPITVPFIMALGVGVAGAIGGKNANENSFGLILQHVWSVLDHDTGYKSGFEVPKEYLRNLNRLAGMLELVDEQFCVIRTGINDYRRQVQSLVSSGSFDEVELNGDSFGNYLELRPFDMLNRRIASINQAEIHETSLTRFLSVFASFGFKTLGDIDRLIKRDTEDAYQLAVFQLANTDLDIINSSLGVISLCAVHVLKQGGGVFELTRFLETFNGVSASNKHRAEGIFRVAQNLSFMKK